MKAVVYTEYGPADVLHLAEVAEPTPTDNELLIKVHTTTVTSGDCNMRGFTFVPRGFGLLPRLMFGLRRPRKSILGVEFAGEVRGVGKDVTRFQVGDQVCGLDGAGIGAYAEYKCIAETGGVAIKPANLSYAEAAADQEDLKAVVQLVEAGAFKPVIDREYPLAEIVTAHRYVDQGHKKGNVVIRVAENTE
jgi:NADPH:quinone reductase-like Zn-dependent oxidoreductase